MAAPTIAPSEDRRSVALAFKTDEAEVMMAVAPTEVDAMIAGLIPPVPTTHVNAFTPAPVRVQAVVPAERVGSKHLVLFRHPGLGWLAFELRQDDGANLAAGLLAATRAERVAGEP